MEQFVLNVFPNSAVEILTIEYTLDEISFVSLSVYNTSGEKINLLVKELSEPGKHRIDFDLSQLPPGIYVCEAIISKREALKQESKQQMKFAVIK